MSLVTPRALGLALCTVVLGACSFFVEFKDPIDDDAGDDAGVVESGTIVPDAAPTDSGAPSDATVDVAEVPDTNPPPPFTCEGQPDGTPVPGTSLRCCGYQKTALNTNENCGICGLACNVAAGHQCTIIGDYATCTGCARDGGGSNGGCWSGCCYIPIGRADGVCSPSSALACFVGDCTDSKCQAVSGPSTCKRANIDGAGCGY